MKALPCALFSALLATGCGGLIDLGSSAGPPPPPNTPIPDDGHPRRMFVTSSLFDGNLGGVAGADAKCAAHASATGLTGTYLAWLSTSQTSPAQRFTHHPTGYALLDGTVVATSWDDLIDGAIAHAIDLDETGAFHDVPGSLRFAVSVWSSTDTSGNRSTAEYDDLCDDFTVGVATGSAPDRWGKLGQIYDSSGAQDFTDLRWTDGAVTYCSVQAALYCVEQ